MDHAECKQNSISKKNGINILKAFELFKSEVSGTFSGVIKYSNSIFKLSVLIF